MRAGDGLRPHRDGVRPAVLFARDGHHAVRTCPVELHGDVGQHAGRRVATWTQRSHRAKSSGAGQGVADFATEKACSPVLPTYDRARAIHVDERRHRRIERERRTVSISFRCARRPTTTRAARCASGSRGPTRSGCAGRCASRGRSTCAFDGHGFVTDSMLIAVAKKFAVAPSIVIVIGVMRPPIRRMPAMLAYAVPASALPPLRATESASCANVCAAAAASVCCRAARCCRRRTRRERWRRRSARFVAPCTECDRSWLECVAAGNTNAARETRAAWGPFAPHNPRRDGAVTRSVHSNGTRSCTGKLVLRSVATAT